MLTNQIDFDQALNELQAERPSSACRERSFEAIAKPQRASTKFRGLAIGATAAIIAAVILFPAQSNGFSWNEALNRTDSAENLHLSYLDREGRLLGEYWRSDFNSGSWLKDASGHLIVEIRKDSRHLYSFLRQDKLTSANAFQYGTLYNRTANMLQAEKQVKGVAFTMGDLVTARRAKVLNQERLEAEGTLIQRYTVEMLGVKKTIDTDLEWGLIREIRGPEGTTKFAYPSSIDPGRFSFKDRISRGVATLDLRGKEDPKSMPPYMPDVIAAKNGIQLREITLSPEGDLFVFWTGYFSKSKRPSFDGIKTGKTRWFDYYKDGLHPASKLICYRVELPEKIGDRVTVRIPIERSVVEFKSMIVKRPKPL